jgi:hypothetical protein
MDDLIRSHRRWLKDSIRKEVDWSAKGPTRPGVGVQNYRVYTVYRRSVLRNWLFCELEPDINWPLQVDGGRMVVWGGRSVGNTGRAA